MDSDDTLKNNAIEVLLQTAQKTNADITICSCRHIKEKNKGNANCDAEQRCLKTVESSEAVKNYPIMFMFSRNLSQQQFGENCTKKQSYKT